MDFKISIAQINPKTGDIAGNTDQVLKAIGIARSQGADLVVFPEMCLTGYCLDEKLLFNRQFLSENKRRIFQEITPACREVTAVVGFVNYEEFGTGPDRQPIRYNAAAVIHRGKVVQVVHKRLLPAYRYFDDKRYFQPGTEVEPVRLEFGKRTARIGVLICEDLWDEGYPLKPTEIYCDKGVDYLLCLNASPFVCSGPGARDGKRFARDEQIQAQIERYRVPIVYVNTVGVGDNGKNIIPFDGQSVAFDKRGKQVAALAPFREEQRTVRFDSGTAQEIETLPFDREGEIFDALVMSVRDYYDKVGIFNGVLEAVSGGIDSALGTAIAAEAMGPELVTAVNLPSRYNSQTTRDAAKKLADNFGIEYKIVPIQSIVEKLVQDFERYLHPIRDSVTVENIQARIRGLIMMAESNDRNALLLTNGNESEMALGYATLYGDMVGGVAVIGDLPKPDVYRVSAYVNRKYGKEMIPREIFEIPASAELKEAQVDPFDYEVVGPVVNEFVEKGKSPNDLIESFKAVELVGPKYPEGLYSRYDAESFAKLVNGLYRKMNQSVYKRVQAAPIVVVSERAFGFDLRETLINGWR
jgi:NAD+ synthase (glutamine-hydrolysing)